MGSFTYNLIRLQAKLKKSKKILIITHKIPDGDALGSSLGLAHFLRKKQYEVNVISPTDFTQKLLFIPGADQLIIFSEKTKQDIYEKIDQADMIFCLDFSEKYRIGNELAEKIRGKEKKIVLVDHHVTKEQFESISFWNSYASSTAELVYNLIKNLGEEKAIDSTIAQCLYVGIITDTGSFQHAQTTAKVHEIAAELIKKNINHFNIHQNLYQSIPLKKFKLFSYLIENKLFIYKEYKVAYFLINQEVMKKFNIQIGDTDNFVDQLLSIEKISVTAVMKEYPNYIKLTFRSDGICQVNEIAKQYFHGGGHENAAGGISKLSLEETQKKFENIFRALNL